MDFSSFKKDKRVKVAFNQKFEIRVMMDNGGTREVFMGAGQDAYDKAMPLANKIAELYGDSVTSYLYVMSKANTSH